MQPQDASDFRTWQILLARSQFDQYRMLMKRAVVIELWTVVFAAQGTPLQFQMPPGTCLRTSESLSSRSSLWFSWAASRLRKPEASCLEELPQTFELS